MATIDKPPRTDEPDDDLLDEEGLPWLENGEQMTQKEFHERYKKTPPGFKAELIDGVVYVMSSPLSIRHGRSDAKLIGWLYLYSSATPGTEVQNNTTTILGDKSEPQPDSALLVLPECGGQSREARGEVGYTDGAPELVVEVAQSTRSLDLGPKLRDYERAGVREYLVWDLKDQQIRWFALRDGRLVPLPADPDGLLRSQVFPGLWLDPKALIANDKAAVNAALNRGLATPEHAAFVADLQRRRGARGRGG